MRNIIIVSVAIILFCINNSKCQETSTIFKEKFLSAQYYELYEQYEQAISIYQELLKKYPNNANLNFRIGWCYFNIPTKKTQAIPYFEKAITDINVKYKEGSYKETKAPKQSLYYLADAYRFNNEFDKAIATYQQFKQYLDVKEVYDFDVVNRQIQTCENAKVLIKYPVIFSETNLGSVINSSDPEINPVVTADESVIFYSVIRNPNALSTIKSNGIEVDENTGKTQTLSDLYEEIYMSKKVDGQWSSPINITKELKSDGFVSTLSVSHDGQHLLLFKDDLFKVNIFESKLVNGKWIEISKLNKNINTKYSELHASITADKKTIYFSSDRPGGFGGVDIYKSELTSEGEWGPAQNLGPVINTPFDDDIPNILEDGKTLYFCSEGHYNMGGFDIFMSKKTENGSWSVPLNIGYPINTPDDDLFFYPLKNGEIAYYHKAANDGFGGTDIYRLKVSLPEERKVFDLKGVITLQDKLIEPDDNITIAVCNASTKDTLSSVKLDNQTGQYLCNVQPGECQIVFKANNYKTKTETIFLPAIFGRVEFILNTELIPEEMMAKEEILAHNKEVAKKSSEKETKSEKKKITEKEQPITKSTTPATETKNKKAAEIQQQLATKKEETQQQITTLQQKVDEITLLAVKDDKAKKEITEIKKKITEKEQTKQLEIKKLNEQIIEKETTSKNEINTLKQQLAEKEKLATTNSAAKIEAEQIKKKIAEKENNTKTQIETLRKQVTNKELETEKEIAKLNTEVTNKLNEAPKDETIIAEVNRIKEELEKTKQTALNEIEELNKQLIAAQTTTTSEIETETTEPKEYVFIKSVYFDYDSYQLTTESKVEIERVLKIMQANPKLDIEIVGHTDSRGATDYNKRLSVKRAQAVMNYMIEKGIDAKELTLFAVAKGVGHKEQAAPNVNPDGSDNPEGRKLNRRVEIKILKSSDEMIVIEDVFTPEAIKNKNNLKYLTVLLFVKDPINASYFEEFNSKGITNVQTYAAKKGYIYTTPSFSKKYDAIQLLNTAIDLGFDDAQLITNFELEDLKNHSYEDVLISTKPGETAKVKTSKDQKTISEKLSENKLTSDKTIKTTTDLEKKKTEPITSNEKTGIYTIQLSSVKTKADRIIFEQFDEVKEYLIGDYYIYTYGNFDNLANAKEELQKIINAGKYKDAVVVKSSKYSAFSPQIIRKPTAFTIQLASSRFKSDMFEFKGLDNVKEHKVGDYYIYTYGTFSSRSEARTELQKITSNGKFSNAIIVVKDENSEDTPQTNIQQHTTTTPIDDKAANYTIQLTSSRRQSDKHEFKGLKNVVEHQLGEFYIYTYGTFETKDQAKTELQRIIEKTQKFKDAIVVSYSKFDK